MPRRRTSIEHAAAASKLHTTGIFRDIRAYERVVRDLEKLETIVLEKEVEPWERQVERLRGETQQ